MAKVAEVAHIHVLSFYPGGGGGEIEPIFGRRAAVTEIEPNF